MLVISKLRQRYGSAEEVLKGIDLTVEDKRLTAVIGSSGAGKSTLLRCINRLVEPSSGSIVLNGVDLVKLRGKRLREARRKIGMIFQAFNLVNRLTVMENVLSGRLGYVSFWPAAARRFPQDDIDRAYQLLERVGMERYVNTRADALSGGERQRVGVVRALMQQPEILLADEPTASLDPKTSLRIMQLVRELSEELTLPVLLNLHDVALAKRFTDRIIGLKEGHIVFDGKPEDLDHATLEHIYGGEVPGIDGEAVPSSRVAEVSA